MIDIIDSKIYQVNEIIRKANYVTAFTGAGISVESGIPTFRGAGGLWERFDPKALDLIHFHTNPGQSWKVIREIFYSIFGNVQPNEAHQALASMENLGFLKSVITQNIDGLHQKAGNRVVYELHGTLETLVCTKCKRKYKSREITFKSLPLYCSDCEGLLKPDFIFFGEELPQDVYNDSREQAAMSDVFLIIGTTGMVAPASYIPVHAKKNGCTIIEINTESSQFTNTITDIFLKGKSSEIMTRLLEKIVDDGWKKQD